MPLVRPGFLERANYEKEVQVEVPNTKHTKGKVPNTKQSFANTLEARLESTMLGLNNVETAWSTLRDTVCSTAMECLGPQTRKHKDWSDEHCTEIQQLLEEKRRVYKAFLDDPKSTAKKYALKTARSNIQRRLREMQNSWLSSEADEIQDFANRNDMKIFYH